MMCSCSDSKPEQQPEDETQVTVTEEKPSCSMVLPIAHNDTLDPFHAQSAINRSIITLLYDSLIIIDESFEPQLLLADSFSLNDKNLTVGVGSAVFSDGSPITVQDVIYSFELARKSDYYSARLAGFSSAREEAGKAVFTLKSTNIFALSCLDFPIVKQGTAHTPDKNTELYELALPTGSGKYTVSGTLPNATLKANPKCARNEDPYITEISLFEVTDSDGMAYGLQIGNYDLWYNDLSSGEFTRVNAGLSVVPTNNFVYLAFNSDKAIFREAAVRKSVSMLLDREQLISLGFHGYATATNLPFNPSWAQTQSIASSGSPTAQTEAATALLESAGYSSVNAYGYRCSKTKSLTASLLVCSGNSFKKMLAEQIKHQLATVNFNINIVELDYEEYVQAIENGEFEMYLGEIRLTPDMNLSGLFDPEGKLNAVIETPGADEEGVWEINVCCDAYSKVRSGSLSLSDFCLLFEEEMPFVPLCYRTAALVYSRDFQTEIKGTCYDNFYYSALWQTESEETK